MDKLDFNKPEELQTRNGREVRIYATDSGSDYPIHGAFFNTDDSAWELCSWTARGRHLAHATESLQDLIRKPYRMTGWVNVYEGVFGSTIFATKEAAKAVAGERALGQIYVDAEVQE